MINLLLFLYVLFIIFGFLLVITITAIVVNTDELD